MSLDFKKGFDTINHNFLFSLLEELRFKESHSLDGFKLCIITLIVKSLIMVGFLDSFQ